MRRWTLVLAAAVLTALLPFAPTRAEDSVQLSRETSLIGEHLLMQVRVLAPEGATVELTPGTATWGSVELVRVEEVTQAPQSDGVLWFIEARVAPFLPGALEFAPTVLIVEGSEATARTLPAVQLQVAPSLPADADLVLSPLAPPTEIPGAESPLLRPALALGAVAGAAIVVLCAWLLVRWARQRLRKAVPSSEPGFVPPTLEGAEQLLHSDPVGAYRVMSAVVKTELARRYGLRATALTTTELRRRLEAGGDRWEARLVGGLLEECDSVIYAGYRPAAERRQADLTMAREIVEVAG